AAANSGGIARDVLIGAIPPGAISDWRYLGISLAAGLLTFYFSTVIIRLWNPVLLFDAAGLALRCLGCAKGTRPWLRSGGGDVAWHVDGNWRRHDARRAADRNPYCVTF